MILLSHFECHCSLVGCLQQHSDKWQYRHSYRNVQKVEQARSIKPWLKHEMFMEINAEEFH